MTTLNPKTIVITTIRRSGPSLSSTMSSERMADILDAGPGPRKRRRLTHLSPDEKLMRRKLKNRVAAQTARDRKKALMSDLEVKLVVLEAQNKKLQRENNSLKAKSQKLGQENLELRERLGQTTTTTPSDSSCVPHIKIEHESPESAVLSAPLQQEQIQALSHWMTHCALWMLTMSLLQQISEEASSPGQQTESDITMANSDIMSVTKQDVQALPIKVVGPTTAELESVKELIKFDHVYHKTDSASPVSLIQGGDPGVEVKLLDSVNVDGMHETPVSLQDSLELPDFGTLLQQGLSVPMDTTNVISQEETTPANMDITTTETSCLKRKFSVSDFTDLDYINDIQVLSPDQSLSGLVSSVGENSARSSCDSGYSDFSDVASPCSDISSSLGDEPWEDSFTDLFPDLL